MPSAINRAPRSPRARRITSDAGVDVCASPSTPSTRRQTNVTARYSAITADDTDHQTRGKIAPRIAHLSADEARRLPTAVGEQHRNHCRREADGAAGVRWIHSRHRWGWSDEKQPGADQHRDRRELCQHQRALQVASGSHAETVDDCQNRQASTPRQLVPEFRGQSARENSGRK